jgi:hypothetical protein
MWPSCGLKLASSDVEENDDDDDDDDDNNNNNKLNLATSAFPQEDLLHDIRKSLVRLQYDERQTDRQTDTRTGTTHVRNLLTPHMGG